MSSNVAELKPKAFFAHGTPEACLESELLPGDKRKSFSSTADWMNRFEASFVTSKRAEEIWKIFDYTGEKIHRITKGIDLSWWVRSSMKQDLEGEPSILYGEIWRNIKHPLYLFYAANEVHKQNEGVKLNTWGCNIRKPFWEQFIQRANFEAFLGKHGIRGIVDYPEHYYSRGDIYFGSAIYGDLSRSMQEATACGCPVITWDTDPYGDSHAYRYAKAFDINDLADKLIEIWNEVADDREGVALKCRKIAEKYFDVNQEAKQVVDVLRKAVAET